MEINDSTADDGDIDPGCYVLDIGTRGKEDKMWVRAEYIRMFEFAETFYAENACNTLSPCLVITGQPGIGKSVWHWYALQMCCAQRKPVIWYLNGTCWLFVEGVFRQPTTFDALCYETVVWTLVDSVDTPSGPPTGLITHGTRHFIIYTLSPTPSRWEKINQSMTRVVCVMNPWSRAEIHKVASFKAAGMSFTAINEIFDHLGPTLRLCFGNTRSLIDYRRKLDEALGRLTLGGLEDMSFLHESQALDAVSCKIYMLKCSNVDVDSVEVDMTTITPFIASKVAAQMWALECYELVCLFNHWIRLPSTRGMAGDVFEPYCHITFSTRIEFEFVPMVHIGGAKEPQWHLSHTKFPESPESKALEALRVEASSKTISLSIDPSRVVDYGTDEVTNGIQVEADVYYIPLKANQVGIDSFILHNDTLYLLQMTTSAAHDIKEKLVPFLLSLKGTPSRSRWHFIFVKPSLHILACPVPKCTVLQDLVLYSAEVEVKS
ncbi:hypothetical protein PILCRDRAFT_58282 [Piloderma croceum F 1598]|uniref:Crinkler (CRN) family protein n=1 Tax=Piloderma croceum (strain F 1598) TaxID=765440 RepID=A0A0C3GMN9_PILCF|nr:hypothetical protein PILCRDRAFT_58282 [Piloderma croceum F 1598]